MDVCVHSTEWRNLRAYTIYSIKNQYLLESKMAELAGYIEPVIMRMSQEEKGMLRCILEYGKEVNEKASSIIEDTSRLGEYGRNLNEEWVTQELNSAFEVGTGFMDQVINDVHNNYGKQLDIVINEVLIQSLKVTKPFFSSDIDEKKGVLQREQWITEKLMDSMIAAMDEDAKKEFVHQVERMLRAKGIDYAQVTKTSAILLTGGLTAARKVMGFQFHILVAQVANMVVRMIAGRGLSVAANAMLQKFVATWFGPVGWIIGIFGGLGIITSLINPREYDKYIPSIFIIGAARIAQNS